MPLTDVQIRNAKPREKQYKLSDGGWLYLLVMPTGSKLWRLAYRHGGKEKLISLGRYPEIALKEAREKRDEMRRIVSEGADPSQKRKLDKISRANSAATTFQLVADEYLDKLRKDGRASATLEKKTWLIGLAKPILGTRPISEIQPAEVLAVLRPLEAAEKLETARRCRETIGAVCRYAIATARATSDPTSALRGAIRAPKPKNHAAITDAKSLGGLLRAIDGYMGQPATIAALKLALLFFTRPGELRHARWSEFDFAERKWTVPAERTKMRKRHEVPLSRQAIDTLEQLRLITGAGELVFPGLRSTRRPISENTLNAALRRMGYSKEEVTAHGFRATASTLLNESKRFFPDAVERALAHADPDPIRGIYNRAQHWDERVDMMQWWADRLDELRNSSAKSLTD